MVGEKRPKSTSKDIKFKKTTTNYSSFSLPSLSHIIWLHSQNK